MHYLADEGPYSPETVIVDCTLGMIYRVGGDQWFNLPEGGPW